MVTSVSVSRRRQTISTSTGSKTFRLHTLNKKTNEWQAICPSSDHFYNVNEVGLRFSSACFPCEIPIAASHGTVQGHYLRAQQTSAYPVIMIVRLTASLPCPILFRREPSRLASVKISKRAMGSTPHLAAMRGFLATAAGGCSWRFRSTTRGTNPCVERH